MVKKLKEESTKEKPLSHLDRILETLNIEGYNFYCISQESSILTFLYASSK